MSYIFPKGYGNGVAVAVRESLRFGAMMGLLWFLPHTVTMHSAYSEAMDKLMIVDVIWHLSNKKSAASSSP